MQFWLIRKLQSSMVIQSLPRVPSFPIPVALTELFCFLLDVPSIEGTIVERRIKEVAASGYSTKTAYALKSTSQSLSRSDYMYSPA